MKLSSLTELFRNGNGPQIIRFYLLLKPPQFNETSNNGLPFFKIGPGRGGVEQGAELRVRPEVLAMLHFA